MAVSHIAEGSRVTIGGCASVEAVVSAIRPGRIEVVYLDQGGRAQHREAIWERGAWKFAGSDEQVAPADNNKRLEAYVTKLRSGT